MLKAVITGIRKFMMLEQFYVNKELGFLSSSILGQHIVNTFKMLIRDFPSFR